MTNGYEKVIFFIIKVNNNIQNAPSGRRKENKTEVNRLYVIKPVGKDRPAEVVAQEALALFRAEFRYNILDLTRLFCCQRDWVEDNLLPEVLHIHLNRFFRDYVIAQAGDLSEAEFTSLHKGHYFFSETDLARYWMEHAKADKKTNLVDLADYAAPGRGRAELEQERARHQRCLRRREERALHRAHMRALLTGEGFSLFETGLERKFDWVGVPTPPWSAVRGKLVSETVYRRQNGYTTSSAAHVRLVGSGAVRCKLGSRTLWLPNEQPDRDYFWPFPVQA